MSVSFHPAATSSGSGTQDSTTPKVPTNGVDGLANTNTFLQLLIAQIRNQDPLNPTDGTQFLSQLAQFSSLEQNINIRTDLDSIKDTLNNRLPAPTQTQGQK